MHELKKAFEKELHELESKAKSGQRFTMQELDRVHKLTDIVKNINKNEMYDQFSEEGEVSFDDGMSYARGRRNAKRDSMGRYSRDGAYERGYSEEGSHRSSYDGNSYGDSYRNSYGDGKERMKQQMREMMDMAETEKERKAIHRCMQELG